MNPITNGNHQLIQTDKDQQNEQLTLEEQEEINHLLEHYPDPGGATIDALKTIQKFRGWVSDGAISALAAHMKLPLANVESVATFYNLIFRQQVGETLVHPCNGISCLLMGYRDIQTSLKQNLNIKEGETCPKTDITLISLPCLGACDKAPVMFVRQSNRSKHPETDSLYENLKPEEIAGLLKQLSTENNNKEGAEK